MIFVRSKSLVGAKIYYCGGHLGILMSLFSMECQEVSRDSMGLWGSQGVSGAFLGSRKDSMGSHEAYDSRGLMEFQECSRGSQRRFRVLQRHFKRSQKFH